jgi:hypothetical protein
MNSVSVCTWNLLSYAPWTELAPIKSGGWIVPKTTTIIQTMSIYFRDWIRKKPTFRTTFLRIAQNWRDIKSVSELYEQRLYINIPSSQTFRSSWTLVPSLQGTSSLRGARWGGVLAVISEAGTWRVEAGRSNGTDKGKCSVAGNRGKR